MASEQKKFQKKKERERLVRKKVLRKREVTRLAKKAEAEKETQLEREYQGSEKPLPVINDPAKKDAMIKRRLEENMKILEALEQEYLREQEARNDINEKLEAEGAMTLAEKLDALGLQQHGLGKIGGSADVTVRPREQPAIEPTSEA